jgi:uncharacterized protein YbjQ (UPF0145 family)
LEKINQISTEEFDQLTDKITEGVKLAIHRLVEKTKKEGGELVISRNGKVVRVRARDLEIK